MTKSVSANGPWRTAFVLLRSELLADRADRSVRVGTFANEPRQAALISYR
jgi:hypothetical protein